MQFLLTKIFYDTDNFLQQLQKYLTSENIAVEGYKKFKDSSSRVMTLSEIMTIVIFFHLSDCRTFKRYYIDYVSVHLRQHFPNLVSYNGFIELMPQTLPLMVLFMKFSC